MANLNRRKSAQSFGSPYQSLPYQLASPPKQISYIYAFLCIVFRYVLQLILLTSLLSSASKTQKFVYSFSHKQLLSPTHQHNHNFFHPTTHHHHSSSSPLTSSSSLPISPIFSTPSSSNSHKPPAPPPKPSPPPCP